MSVSYGKGNETLDRFFEKIGSIDNCWIWVGAKARKGYSAFWHNKRQMPGHSFSYSYFVADIPRDYEIDHLCRVPACVNPDHLEAVTHLENVSRGKANYNKYKTHCKKGHEFTEENTYKKRGIYRDCRMCNRLRGRKEVENVS